MSTDLQQQLGAASQRIEKLEGALQSAINSAKRRKSRAEAAERKLATARNQHFAEFLDLTCKINPWIDRARMEQALAQIEQPQEDEGKQSR